MKSLKHFKRGTKVWEPLIYVMYATMQLVLYSPMKNTAKSNDPTCNVSNQNYTTFMKKLHSEISSTIQFVDIILCVNFCILCIANRSTLLWFISRCYQQLYNAE
jgi:hypothetical protein